MEKFASDFYAMTGTTWRMGGLAFLSHGAAPSVPIGSMVVLCGGRCSDAILAGQAMRHGAARKWHGRLVICK